MGTVSEDSNIDSQAMLRASAQQKKCGTCRNFVVRPPEIELAKYAMPMGACAPGVHCLGGAVRGTCSALGIMVESTDRLPRVACGGRSYVAGGPSSIGQPTPADRQRERQREGRSPYGSASRQSPVPQVTLDPNAMTGVGMTLVAVVAIPVVKAALSWMGWTTGGRDEEG